MEYITVILIFTCSLSSSQKNLSPFGTATQSSTYQPYVASLAITGGPTNDFNTGSCTHTDRLLYVAWWMLTLPNQTSFIEQVIIYYRSQSNGIDGFYLYISNTSITGTNKQTPPGHLCYHDVADGKYTDTYTIQCNQLAQHVIFYNDKLKNDYGAFVELCDVQVIGCPKTWFGAGCGEKCSLKCFDQHCYPSNGSCVWGCNCLYNDCDSDQTCTSGCKSGFGGQHCNKNNLASSGVPTQYPPESDYPARLAIDGIRIGHVCARTSGFGAWWSLDLVKISVILTINLSFQNNDTIKQYANAHSLYISNSSETWKDGQVLQMTSDFESSFPVITYNIHSAVVGRYIVYEPKAIGGATHVDICEVEVVGCAVGFYGEDCKRTCPENCYGPCNVTNGVCMFGCMDGWINSYCNKTCDNSNFGQECKYTCHCYNKTKECDHVTGTCPEGGCIKGWKGTSCSSGCTVGQYGYNCNHSCNGCLLRDCDSISGECVEKTECNSGWIKDPPFCQKGCSSGFFGTYCDSICNKCLLTKCNRLNGSCTHGCIEGYSGYKCNAKAQQSEDNVNNYTAVVGGVLATVIIVQAVFIVLLIRRQNICIGGAGKSDDPYEMSRQENAGNNSYSTLTMGREDVTLRTVTQDTENDFSNLENVYEMPELNMANI